MGGWGRRLSTSGGVSVSNAFRNNNYNQRCIFFPNVKLGVYTNATSNRYAIHNGNQAVIKTNANFCNNVSPWSSET